MLWHIGLPVTLCTAAIAGSHTTRQRTRFTHGAAVLAELMQVASDLQADAAVVAEAAAETPLRITRCSRGAAEPPAQVSAAARVPPQTWRPGA